VFHKDLQTALDETKIRITQEKIANTSAGIDFSGLNVVLKLIFGPQPLASYKPKAYYLPTYA
jgi:hypothetical protein